MTGHRINPWDWQERPVADGNAIRGLLFAFFFSFVGGLFLAGCYVVGVWMHS